MKFRRAVKRILIYFIVTLLAFLLQTSVFPMLTFLYAAPNLLIIVTFSCAYIYGSTTGIICGIFAGLLMDIFYDGLFGVYLLIFSYLGYLSGLFHSQLSNDSILMPLFICIVNEFLYSAYLLFYRFLLLGYADPLYSLTHRFLPETFFTLLVTLVLYRILLLVNQRMDRIDDIRGQNVA